MKEQVLHCERNGANKNKRISNKTYINVLISIIWEFNNFLKFSYFKEDPPKLTRRNDNEQQGKN